MSLYGISYGFKTKPLENALRFRSLLSLNGDYKESKTNSLVYFKADASFEQITTLLRNKFNDDGSFAVFILEKGKYKCINEPREVFKWLWEE